MNRDMELVRKLLLAIEARESSEQSYVDLPNYTERQVWYHTKLLCEAGLIEGLDVSCADEPCCWLAGDLTWQGHEFLGAARNEGIWRSAMNKTKEATTSVTFEVLKELLVKGARGLVGLD